MRNRDSLTFGLPGVSPAFAVLDRQKFGFTNCSFNTIVPEPETLL